jgi:hypothetical protein
MAFLLRIVTPLAEFSFSPMTIPFSQHVPQSDRKRTIFLPAIIKKPGLINFQFVFVASL